VEWEAQLARLAAYKAAHGDCNVPQRWAEDPRLGNWVSNQRKCKRKLDRGDPSEVTTAERVAKLEVLGFAWELSAAAISIQNSKATLDDAGWETQLAKLKVYKRRHGDCSVPKGWAADPTLANWVMTQRRLKRKLDRGGSGEGMSAERAAKLEALGFEWDPTNGHGNRRFDQVGWEAQLVRLAAYKAVHGDCMVPWGWAEDPRLGRWVSKQRRGKRQLDRGEPSEGMTVERAARLTALGLVWDPPNAGGIPKEAEWEAQLARLAAYKVVHGDCSVPWGWAEDPRLGEWVSKQRLHKRKLDRGEPSEGITAERVAKLTSLGLNWNGTKRSSEDAQSTGSASGGPKKQPRLQ
jgi:hypothetical protein